MTGDKTIDVAIHRQKQFDLALAMELLHYDPDTGIFTWKKRTHSRMHVGQVAGHMISSGYWIISIGGVKILAHRLAWGFMTGALPEHLVDHEDTNPLNNRWKNLRAADRSQNNSNRAKTKPTPTGFRGVQEHKSGRFKAKIQHRGKQIYLGMFDTPEEASIAYEAAALKYHGQFARTT